MFEIGYVRFLDSYQFLSTSLENLVSLLLNSGRDKFTNTTKYLSNHDLVFAKGVYPYSYITSSEKIRWNWTTTNWCILWHFQQRTTRPGTVWACSTNMDLFRISHNEFHHVLHRLLPPICSTTYKLRPRTHNRVLPDRFTRLTDFNFVTRMLFYNTYWFVFLFCVSTIVQLRSDSMLINGYVMFRLLKDDWVCTILLSFCMFYRPRLGIVLVSACLTIHSFSSGISYFKSILLYCVVSCYWKIDLIWFDSISNAAA